MKRSISLTMAAAALIIWFGACINMMIRYNMDWVDYAKYSFDLTSAQQDYFSKAHITCGVKYNSLPLSFVNEEKQNDGIFIDFIDLLSVELENDMDIRLNQEKDLVQDFKNGDIQAAIVDKSQLPADEYLFTEPLYIMHGKMLVKESSELDNINQLADIKVAVEEGEKAVAERIEELYGSKGVSVVYAKDFQQSLDMLENDRVAAVAGDETKLSYLINQQRTNRYYKFLQYSFSRTEICVALDRSNEGLLNAFNKAVLSLKKKNLITKTQSKWFGAMEPEITDMLEVDLIYNIVFLFLICGAAFTVWNLSTAKKVTEKTRELFHSQEQLRLIINTLDKGLLIVDRSGKILEVNDEICRIAGCGRKELLRTDIYTNRWVIPFLQAEDEKVYKLKNHYYMKNTIALSEESKKLYIVEEWTQRYLNQQRNIQEEKMIAVGQLSAGLAHEIRNPLGLIKSYMFLIQDFCKEEDGMHAVQVIDDSIKRINRLIDSLLKFSKLSGEDSKNVDVKELITNILILEKKQMDNKKIDVEFSLTGNRNGQVRINEDLVKITIINLLNNSIDALAEVDRGRKIQIRVDIRDNDVDLEFRDNGCGIESGKLLEIFNPFYTSKEQGTGLGLYLVHSQLKQAGGTIRADSTLGEGTVFYVRIPIQSGAQNPRRIETEDGGRKAGYENRV